MRRKRSIAGRVMAGILAAALVFTAQTPWSVSAESADENVLTQEETAQQEETVDLSETEDGDGNEANVLETDTGTIVPQESTIVPETETGDSENNGLEDSEEPKELTAPQNLREENGDIVWDEVKDAYGYYLRVCKGEDEYEYTYYVSSVELDRLCYEQKLDFGDYKFEVCSFDEARKRSEWSEAVTATYAPALTAPANVRVSEEREETVLWDEVEGVTRYNIRVFNNDDDRTLYATTKVSYGSYTCNSWWASGDYWISVQAMNKDYDVSEWTEPILVSHTAEERKKLEAPQNVRLDESGENILWDEVEGADSYQINFDIDINTENGHVSWIGIAYGLYLTEPLLKNWKSYIHPFSEEVKIYVTASGSGVDSSDCSNSLTMSFVPYRDETIEVPDQIWFEDAYLRWDEIECAMIWGGIAVNGVAVDGDLSWRQTADSYGHYMCGFPAGNYDVTLAVVDENGKYNIKTYTLTIDTVPDETVWVPKMFYKFETLLWDYDLLRHDHTRNFWVRIKKGDTVVRLVENWDEKFYGLSNLPNGDYTVETCVREWDEWGDDKIGKWSEPLNVTVFDGSLFDKENEVSTEVEQSPDAAGIPEEDRITSITINPAFNMKHKDGDDVELDLTKIQIKANEIYDEEGLLRAEEALGEELKGNKHYNLLDLTLLYDGDDFSNGYEGLVQVIIPIPAGHRDKTFSCYRLTEVDGKMVKEEIPGERVEDSYIIYLEHFSEYALVADGGEGKHDHVFAESWESDVNSHWKECECGEKSEEAEHTYGDWEITREATETEEGLRERGCEVCGYTQTESVPRLTPTEPTEPSKPSEPSGDEKKPVEFENSDTKIKVTAPADAFDKADEIKFNATPVAGQTKGSQFAYDLTFTDRDGNKIQPKVAVTVKIPVPEALKDKTVYAYHVEDNGAYTEISCKVENGTVVFAASKFSTYIITGEKLNGDSTNDGSTNDSNTNETIAGAGYDGWAGVSAEQKAKLMQESLAQNTTVAASPKTDDRNAEINAAIMLLLAAAFCGAALCGKKKRIRA